MSSLLNMSRSVASIPVNSNWSSGRSSSADSVTALRGRSRAGQQFPERLFDVAVGLQLLFRNAVEAQRVEIEFRCETDVVRRELKPQRQRLAKPEVSSAADMMQQRFLG